MSRIRKRCSLVIFIICLVFILGADSLFALPVDLNNFTPIPPEAIVVSADGSSATLYEDMFIAPVSLENTNFFIPSNASNLSFDYELNVPVNNNDYFYVYIEDTSSPVFWAGGPEGTYSGTFTYDVSFLAGRTVPVIIIFDLMPDDWELQSDVTVSNVNINTAIDPNYQDPNMAVCFNMNLPKGWSMISIPVVPDNISLSSVFSDAAVMYKFERGSGYVRVKNSEELQVGEGYWILVNEEQNYVITGQPIHSFITMIYSDGWEMIGGCTYGAETTAENGSIGVIYGYGQETGYQLIGESDSLDPGKGYWILVNNISDICELKVETSGF